METVKKTAEYTILKKRSGRYAVRGADRKWVSGEAKVKILLAEKLIKAPAPKQVEEEAPAEEAVAEEAVAEEAVAEEAVAEEAPAEEAVAEEAPAEEAPAEEAVAEEAPAAEYLRTARAVPVPPGEQQRFTDERRSDSQDRGNLAPQREGDEQAPMEEERNARTRERHD